MKSSVPNKKKPAKRKAAKKIVGTPTFKPFGMVAMKKPANPKKIFYKSPQSDLQLYLEEIAEKEPDITTGKLLKRFDANLPDCIVKIEKNGSEKVRDWKVTYKSHSGEVKEIDYETFASALVRAKKKNKNKI